jgi:succinate-semialdehyde dehydrogenase / glutarate-semialdehyde dehydrogenase
MPHVLRHDNSPSLFIGGTWISARDRQQAAIVDPGTGETMAHVALANANDIAAALASAEAAWPAWRRRSPLERGAILQRAAALLRERASAIAHTLTLEQGKPLAEAVAEVRAAAGHFEWMAEEGRRAYGRVVPGGDGWRQTVLRRPIGVVAAFAPWNFPAVSPAKKIATSLAAGCCCILKAAEETPGTAVEIARALEDAGLPPGVLNLLFGVPAEISRALIESPVVRKVSFTGSTAVGRQLAALAGANVKPITMELGGHAPVLVFDDVDVEAVARQCATAKFRNAGQVCVSPTRFLVHERVYEAFVAALAAAAGRVQLGHGLDDGVGMGPLANARRLAAVAEGTRQLARDGARLRAGGEQLARPGNFWLPTVFSDVPLHSAPMREEPFGPIALATPFRSDAQAIELANALPYGLAAYAFTRDGSRQIRLGEEIEAGLVGLNTFFINGPETPWGGVKDSGYGSEGGAEGLAAYQVSKLVAQAV